jgi:hypothetical protein
VTGSAPDDYYGSYRIKSFDEASKHNRTRLFERLWLGRKAERTPAEGAGFSGDET